MSEWLCQSCWIYTETFHNFYERVQRVHEQKHYRRPNDWFAVGGSGDDVIKAEPEPEQSVSTVLAMDLNSVKFEETTEPSVQTIDSKHESSSSDDCSDDAGSRYSTDEDDDEDEFSNTADHKETNFKRKLRRTASDTNRSAKIAKGDAQICEIFSMKCNMCNDVDVQFKTWQEVRNHYRKVHNTDGYLVCCGRKFVTRYLIMEHVLRHLNPTIHQCDQCDKICANKYALKSHMDAAHAPRDTRLYKCSFCPSSFVKAGVLKVHVLNQHSESGEQFPCEKCGKRLDHGFVNCSLCTLIRIEIFQLSVTNKAKVTRPAHAQHKARSGLRDMCPNMPNQRCS